MLGNRYSIVLRPQLKKKKFCTVIGDVILSVVLSYVNAHTHAHTCRHSLTDVLPYIAYQTSIAAAPVRINENTIATHAKSFTETR